MITDNESEDLLPIQRSTPLTPITIPDTLSEIPPLSLPRGPHTRLGLWFKGTLTPSGIQNKFRERQLYYANNPEEFKKKVDRLTNFGSVFESVGGGFLSSIVNNNKTLSLYNAAINKVLEKINKKRTEAQERNERFNTAIQQRVSVPNNTQLLTTAATETAKLNTAMRSITPDQANGFSTWRYDQSGVNA